MLWGECNFIYCVCEKMQREYWLMNFEKFIKEITNNNWKVYGVENEFANQKEESN